MVKCSALDLWAHGTVMRYMRRYGAAAQDLGQSVILEQSRRGAGNAQQQLELTPPHLPAPHRKEHHGAQQQLELTCPVSPLAHRKENPHAEQQLELTGAAHTWIARDPRCAACDHPLKPPTERAIPAGPACAEA
jgi:hypothetical protein